MAPAREITTGGAECVGENETLADAARNVPEDKVGDMLEAIST